MINQWQEKVLEQVIQPQIEDRCRQIEQRLMSSVQKGSTHCRTPLPERNKSLEEQLKSYHETREIKPEELSVRQSQHPAQEGSFLDTSSDGSVSDHIVQF